MKAIFKYLKEIKDTAKYMLQGLQVTFDHMGRRPVTIQYPYEKLIPSERYRVAYTLSWISVLHVKYVLEYVLLISL